MVEKEKYKFRLRENMPKGFIVNETHPELPAIYRFLKRYRGEMFGSPEEFKEKVLSEFLNYLNSENIPEGDDPKLREGLDLEESPERIEGMGDYFVFTPATNGPGRCVFGGLERMAIN